MTRPRSAQPEAAVAAPGRPPLQLLHRLVRGLNADLDLGRTLRSVCQGVVDGLGLRTAVLDLVQPDGSLAVVACAGAPAARADLLGSRASREEWDALMAACDPLGDLLVHRAGAAPGPLRARLPEEPAQDGPQLLAPLRTVRSGLLGVLTVDLPPPDEAHAQQRELLELFVAQAALAVENAQLHTALRRQVDEDRSERRLLEEELRTASDTDALTGLPHRAAFTARLERAAASGRGARVLLVDLDAFTSVNDAAGHAAGDRVLVEVARRTVAACRAADLVARLSGDELVVLLGDDVDDGAAEALAGRLVEALGEPVQVGGASLTVSASVGIARLTGPGSADDLLRDADVALQAAKAAGKGQYRVFEPGLRAELLGRTGVVHDLREALRTDELFVRWHPVVRVADARLLGFEALVRWRHPTRGELAPALFVPVAEASGLVVELGRQVLHAACRQLREWQRTVPGSARTQISVNLSPVQVHSDVVATVREVLRDTGLDPGRLLLELTEDVLLEDVDGAVEVLRELRALGVRLAVDDFGAGYSSLAYLKRLPVDVVKLDRSLLVGVEGDPSALALFDAVVGLVRRLGLTGVAEGVETTGQWRLLERLQCPVAQGFLVARPLLAEDVPRLLGAGRPSSGTRPAG